MNMRFNVLATLLLILSIPILFFAQTSGAATNGTFTVSISPQYPEPWSQATLTILSSDIDMANATVDVSAAGDEIYQGSVRPVEIQMGKAGSIANVKIVITSNGANYSKIIPIQAQDVAIVAEPVSSAPVLYPGKPLVPIEGKVRIVAIANLQDTKGKVLDPNALSYSWTVDDVQIANSSGIGKQAIVVSSPLQYRARSVSVSVMSQDGSLFGGAEISISSQDPSVRIYKNDPLLGILFDNALSGEYSIIGSEDTFYAAPFSLPTTDGAPTLQWLLNEEVAQAGNSITLKPSGSGEGSASLSVIASVGESVSRASENLSLLFGTESGFGLFGL